MHQYLDLLADVLRNGLRQSNRTGIDCLTLPGAFMKFDMADGFPAVTTKKLAFNQVKGELIGFLRGYDNAAKFRELGCTIWDQNSNENREWLNNPARLGTDDLGSIYGVQWRAWAANGGVHIDQVAQALSTVRNNPTSRRIIVSAWNPSEFKYMALPPCHIMFQLLPHVETKTLHMMMYQRSCDMFLGVPFNIASYALLLHLFAAWTGYKAGTLSMAMADVHIYENHIEQVKEQLTRTEFALPTLKLNVPDRAVDLDLNTLLRHLQPDCIQLENYQCHPALKAPMAV